MRQDQVLITMITGKTLTIDLTEFDTVLSVRQKIAEQTGLDLEKFFLVYQGKKLEDDKANFLALNTWKEEAVHLIVRRPEASAVSTSTSNNNDNNTNNVAASYNNPVFTTSYSSFPIEFIQFLSATTQDERHELGKRSGKPHPSTEEYWNQLSDSKKQDLEKAYKKTMQPQPPISEATPEAPKDNKCTIS